jgi:hypothetical protein
MDDFRKQAFDRVNAERDRQTGKWGSQDGNHPFEWVSILGEEYGEFCEAVNETYFSTIHVRPERGGLDKIIEEATHVAAVAVAVVEAALKEKTGFIHTGFDH